MVLETELEALETHEDEPTFTKDLPQDLKIRSQQPSAAGSLKR
jgi:hypothetical protein